MSVILVTSMCLAQEFVVSFLAQVTTAGDDCPSSSCSASRPMFQAYSFMFTAKFASILCFHRAAIMLLGVQFSTYLLKLLPHKPGPSCSTYWLCCSTWSKVFRSQAPTVCTRIGWIFSLIYLSALGCSSVRVYVCSCRTYLRRIIIFVCHLTRFRGAPTKDCTKVPAAWWSAA